MPQADARPINRAFAGVGSLTPRPGRPGAGVGKAPNRLGTSAQTPGYRPQIADISAV